MGNSTISIHSCVEWLCSSLGCFSPAAPIDFDGNTTRGGQTNYVFSPFPVWCYDMHWSWCLARKSSNIIQSMKVWKTRQRIFKSNHSTIVTGLRAAFHFFSCFPTCSWCQMWHTRKKNKTKKKPGRQTWPGYCEKSDRLTAWTLPCCLLQLQSFYCLRPSSFGLVTMSQFVSITCTLALERAQLCFTITEHWHRCGWTDFGLTKINLFTDLLHLFMFWITLLSYNPLADLNVHFVAIF